MNFKHINRVGVEMEGGWSTAVTPALRIGGDGSVHVVADRQGEVRTAPLGSWTAVQGAVRSNNPTVVNESCGLHVHISFRSMAAYMELMDDARAQDELVEALAAWGTRAQIPAGHPFWARLRGENQFCRKAWQPVAQVEQTHKGAVRYAAMNFCFRLHGTLEVRILSMFDKAEETLGAIGTVLGFVESYLEKRGVVVPAAGVPAAFGWTLVRKDDSGEHVVSRHVFTKRGYDAAWHKAKAVFGVAKPSSRRWESGMGGDFRIVAEAATEQTVPAVSAVRRVFRIVVTAERAVAAA